MARNNESLLNSSSSYGTSGGTVLSSPSVTDDTDILNTDENSLSDTPLRSDLDSGMTSDVSAGVTSGTDFMGNLDSDTDAGLSTESTGVSDAYAIPAAINDDNLPVPVPTSDWNNNGGSGDSWNNDGENKADQAKATISNVADTAKAQASQLVDQAKTQATALASQATDQVKAKLDDHKSKAAESLTAVTDAIRQSADSLTTNGQAPIGNAVSSFAGQVENWTNYLRDKSVDEIATEVGDYAKRNPQVFVGGAFLLGIAIARFLKSSNRNSLGYNNSSNSLGSSNVNSGYNGSYYATPSYGSSTSEVTGTNYDTSTNFNSSSTYYATGE